jgi:acyl-CoA synthetase (AMP-forming)/AMP-acid ligase II
VSRARTVLPRLERVLVAGAPVAPTLVEEIGALLGDRGEVFTPYGATEGLPVASIRGRELLGLRERSESGYGTCVGRAAIGVELCVIPIRDEPIERWDEALRSPPFVLGEVCVRGPGITAAYARENEATRAAKILAEDGVWHRMGDLGYLDDEGRCGSVAARRTGSRPRAARFAPVPTENIAELHPRVRRAALVGVGPPGAQRAMPGHRAAQGPARARAHGARRARALDPRVRRGAPPGRAGGGARGDRARAVPPRFPLDARHNAKKKSELLQRWAQARLK